MNDFERMTVEKIDELGNKIGFDIHSYCYFRQKEADLRREGVGLCFQLHDLDKYYFKNRRKELNRFEECMQNHGLAYNTRIEGKGKREKKICLIPLATLGIT